MAEKTTSSQAASLPANGELLTLDYNNLTADALGPAYGLSTADLADMRKALASAYKEFEAKRAAGELPFTELPSNAEIPKRCRKLGESLRKDNETVVVLGIGGSALGTTAVFNALRPANHNNLPKAKRGGWPSLKVADNIDPEGFGALLESVELGKTTFVVISKSGATAETMSQFLIVHDKLQRLLGRSAVKDRLLIITDPKNGVLRKIVDASGYQSMEVPPGVGGRFTVFSSVGLAPLGMAGVSVYELLAGAKRAQEDFAKPVAENKALLFAGLNHRLTTVKGLGSLVMMPYAESLSKVADWFLQLWNESLGKAVHLDGTPAAAGQTAIKAVGATDQHSQLQLYMEGPRDKAVCLLGVEKFRSDVPIPAILKEHEELAYLGGHSMGELIGYERQGTARALAENGRPNLSLTMPKVGAAAVGYLLQTLMLATVISGTLYKVNPLDQPGVELSKRFTYGLMGRQGFSDMAERYRQGLSVKSKFIVK
jgi:glucose-6-phosphate isomerase